MRAPLKLRRRACAAVLAGALGCLLAGCGRRPASVLLITIDTLRADHVGPQADAVSLTPALDALAADAVSYTNALANCTITRCSHTSILSGLYPWRHGVHDNVTRRAVSPALPALLQQAGLRTGAVVSSFPVEQLLAGFDSYDQGLDYQDAQHQVRPVKRPERTTRSAARFIEERGGEPFFLWVHYFPPHGPYDPPEAFRDRPRQRTPSGESLRVSTLNYDKGCIPAYQALPGVSDAGLMRREYAAHVRYVDRYVGQLLETLRKAGRYDDGLVIVTSDHGESLGEHGWYFQHGNLVYQEQARVPLIVKWPHNARGGTRVDAPVELVDVAPSIARVAGLGALDFDGRPLPEGPAPEPRPRFVQSADAELAAILDGPYKLIAKLGPTQLTDAAYPARELFRLDVDPAEARDLGAAEPGVARRLEAALQARYAGLKREPATLSPETREKLRALGYVN